MTATTTTTTELVAALTAAGFRASFREVTGAVTVHPITGVELSDDELDEYYSVPAAKRAFKAVNKVITFAEVSVGETGHCWRGAELETVDIVKAVKAVKAAAKVDAKEKARCRAADRANRAHDKL